MGLGKWAISARQPAAAMATPRWSSTAPQLITASRPVTSVACGTRCGSKNNFSCGPSATQCHGWLLCTDGARQANSTAFAISWGSGTALVMGQP